VICRVDSRAKHYFGVLYTLTRPLLSPQDAAPIPLIANFNVHDRWDFFLGKLEEPALTLAQGAPKVLLTQ
jgi:hypothetical protein